MANVLHKKTLQYLESVHTPDYDPREWLINPDLSKVEGVDPKYWKISRGRVKEMSSEEKNTQFLGHAKAEAFQRIDERTAALVEEGFLYGGQRFSLSLAAQLRMSEILFLLNSSTGLDYPMVWNTLDNTGQVELRTEYDVRDFIKEGTQTVVARINSGTALKAQVRDAHTISAVGMVTDER